MVHREGLFLRLFDVDTSIGAGERGLDGTLSAYSLTAYRILPSTWSPYVGIGLGGFLRGNDAYTHSELTLPEARVGVHWSDDLGVIELGAGAAPVLVGRFTTDSGRAKLGGAPRIAAYGTVGYDWATLRGTVTRVIMGDTSVTSGDAHLCAAPSAVVVLCGTAHYAVRPLAQGGSTDATVVGLSLGFGGVR
jgi:hypothetical protein